MLAAFSVEFDWLDFPSITANVEEVLNYREATENDDAGSGPMEVETDMPDLLPFVNASKDLYKKDNLILYSVIEATSHRSPIALSQKQKQTNLQLYIAHITTQ